jgi:hypothetical protein
MRLAQIIEQALDDFLHAPITWDKQKDSRVGGRLGDLQRRRRSERIGFGNYGTIFAGGGTDFRMAADSYGFRHTPVWSVRIRIYAKDVQ